jgi:hypothetical protein
MGGCWELGYIMLLGLELVELCENPVVICAGLFVSYGIVYPVEWDKKVSFFSRGLILIFLQLENFAVMFSNFKLVVF